MIDKTIYKYMPPYITDDEDQKTYTFLKEKYEKASHQEKEIFKKALADFCISVQTINSEKTPLKKPSIGLKSANKISQRHHKKQFENLSNKKQKQVIDNAIKLGYIDSI